jgi:hypothetical protein
MCLATENSGRPIHCYKTRQNQAATVNRCKRSQTLLEVIVEVLEEELEEVLVEV